MVNLAPKAIARRALHLAWKTSVWIERQRSPKADGDPYTRKINAIHRLFKIPSDYTSRGLILHRECSSLVLLPKALQNRSLLIDRETLKAYSAMYERAREDNVEMSLKWAYRSVDDQSQLILDRLRWGSSITQILTSVAAPGYSEHHTGRAVDIMAPSDSTADFEKTEVFLWLQENAKSFGFTMSYPRENPHNIIYEPWHWLYES